MKKTPVQFVSFWYVGFFFLILVLDAVFPGFIPSKNYLLPIEVIGITCLTLATWKKWGGDTIRSVTKSTWAWWLGAVALMGGLMYNVYEIAELPRTFSVAGFILIFIISGALLLYEGSYSRRRASDAA